MAKKLSRLLVIFLLVVCSTFGLYACNDPYADMGMKIEGVEFSVTNGQKYLALDLSSEDTSKVVLSASISNLKPGMNTEIKWSTTDASRVALREWVDNGVYYAELSALEITNAGRYVTITAYSVENAKIMDTVKVSCTKPVTSMNVIDGVLGIPLGQDYILSPQNFVTFEPAGASIPNCIFEITGFTTKYQTGDVLNIQSAPQGNILSVKCYPESELNEDGTLPDDAIVAEFEAMLYTPISAESIEIVNVLGMAINGGQDVDVADTGIELIINGTDYMLGTEIVSPNQQTYAVSDKNGTVIDMWVELMEGVEDEILEVDVNEVDNLFTLMGLDTIEQPTKISVVSKVKGIANAPEIRIDIMVSVVEYPNNVVLAEKGVNVNNLLLNYTDAFAVEKQIDVSLSPVSDRIKEVRIELDYNQCNFEDGVLDSIVIEEFEPSSDSTFTAEEQTQMRQIVQAFELRMGAYQNVVSWSYKADGTPYVLLQTPQSIRLTNKGIVMGTVGLRFVVTQSEENPIMQTVQKSLSVVLQQGIERIKLTEDSEKLIDARRESIVMIAGSAELGVVNLGVAVEQVHAKLEGINDVVKVLDASGNPSDGVVVERMEPSVFRVEARRSGEYRLRFEADTGVTFTQKVEVFTPVTKVDVGIPSVYQDAVGDVIYEANGEFGGFYMKHDAAARITLIIDPNGGDYDSISTNSLDTRYAQFRKNAQDNEYYVYTNELQTNNLTTVSMSVIVNTYELKTDSGNRELCLKEVVKEFDVKIFVPITKMTLTQENVDLDWRPGASTDYVYSSLTSSKEIIVKTEPSNATINSTNAVWSVMEDSKGVALITGVTTNGQGKKQGYKATLGIKNGADLSFVSYAVYYVSVRIEDYKQVFEKIITVKLTPQELVKEITIDESSQAGVDAYYADIPGVTDIKYIDKKQSGRERPVFSELPLIVNFDLNKREKFTLDVSVQPSNATIKDVGYLVFDMQKVEGEDRYELVKRDSTYNYTNLQIDAKNASIKYSNSTGKYQIEANGAGYAVVLMVPLDIMTTTMDKIEEYSSFVSSITVSKTILVRIADGSEEFPYELRTAQDVVDLQNISGADSRGIYKLMDNIDMAKYFERNTWAGIGSQSNPFQGKIYSDSTDNLSIYGWNIYKFATQKAEGYTDSIEQNFGIFNYLGNKAEIHNVDFVIENYVVEHYNTYYVVDNGGNTTIVDLHNVGVLAGTNEGTINDINVTIRNYTYTNIVGVDDYYTGTMGTVNLGLVGYNYAGTIRNVDVSVGVANVSGVNVAINYGVLVGKNTNGGLDKDDMVAQLVNNTAFANINILNSQKKLFSNSETNEVAYNVGMLVGNNASLIQGGRVSGNIMQKPTASVSASTTVVDDSYNAINMGGVVGLNSGSINTINNGAITLMRYNTYIFEMVREDPADITSPLIEVWKATENVMTEHALTTCSVVLSGKGNIGGIVGLSNGNNSAINNVKYRMLDSSVKGITGMGNIGGIIGSIDNETSITNAYVVGFGTVEDIVLTGQSVVGGIVGKLDGVLTAINVYTDIDVIESAGVSGSIIGMLLGEVNSGDKDNNNRIRKAHTHGSITLNVMSNAGTIAGHINTGAYLYLEMLYSASTITVGSDTYVKEYDNEGDVTTDEDTCYIVTGGLLYDTNDKFTIYTDNWTNLTNNGFIRDDDKNYGLPYTQVSMEDKDDPVDWLEVVPTEIRTDITGQFNGNYDKVYTEQSGMDVFGDVYSKSDTEIVLRYRDGIKYKLFSEDNSGLFGLEIVPSMMLDEVELVIENSTSGVLSVLRAAKLSDYQIEILSVGTSELTIRSAYDKDVKVKVTIHVIQGFDNVVITDNGNVVEDRDNANILKGTSLNLAMNFVEYYNNGVEVVERIVNSSITGGMAVYVDTAMLFDDGQPYIKINGMEYATEDVNFADKTCKVLYLTRQNSILINALEKTVGAINIYMVPYFTYVDIDNRVQRIVLWDSISNPNSIEDYEVQVYRGVSDLSVDTTDMGIYAGESLGITAELTTDYVDENYDVTLDIYAGDDVEPNALIWANDRTQIEDNIWNVSKSNYYTTTMGMAYSYLLEVKEDARYSISSSQVYTLVFTYVDNNGQDAREYNYRLQLTVHPQNIKGITIEHFSDVVQDDTTHNLTGAGNLPTNSIIPGEFGLLRLNISPDYASYDYIDVISSESFGDSLSMERRKYNARLGIYEQYASDEHSNSEVLSKGLRIYNTADDHPGIYYIRTIISTNMTTAAVFDIVVNAYKIVDDVPVLVATKTQQITIRVLARFELSTDKYSDTTNLSYIVQGTSHNNLIIDIDTTKDRYTNLTVVDNSEYITVELNTQANNTLLKQYWWVNVDNSIALGTKFEITATANIVLDGVTRTVTRVMEFVVVDFYIDNTVLDNLSNFDRSRNSIYLPYIKGRLNELTVWGSLLDEKYTKVIAEGGLVDVNDIVIPAGITVNAENATNVTNLIKTIMLINGYTYNNGSLNSDASKANAYPTVWAYQEAGIWHNVTYEYVYNEGSVADRTKTMVNTHLTALQQSGNNANKYYLMTATLAVNTIQFNLNYTFVNGEFSILNQKTNKKRDTIGASSGASVASFLVTQDIIVDVYQRMANDHPKPIYDREDFLAMAQDGSYILMNDIFLTDEYDWTPMDLNIVGLDGNGYRLYVNSGKMVGVNNKYGVFGTIAEGTLLNNVNVVLQSTDDKFTLQGLATSDTPPSNVDVGLFALENRGILNNCQVESEWARVEDNNKFTYTDTPTTLSIDVDRPTGASYNIAGFVNTNRGSISNSRLLNVGISANGNIAGFVINNYGDIASSYIDSELSRITRTRTVSAGGASQHDITQDTISTPSVLGSVSNNSIKIKNNASASEDTGLTATAGFVSNNYSGAKIYGSYIGNAYINGNTEIRTVGVESAVYSGAFVYTNSADITDCYVAVNMRGAKISSGFVFSNTAMGVITRSFTASRPEVINDLSYTPFVGREGLGTNQPSLADGTFNASYYYNDNYYSSTALLYEKKTQPMSKEHFVNENGQHSGDWDTYSISRLGSNNGAEFNGIWVWNNDEHRFFKDSADNIHLGPRLVGADTESSFDPRYITDTTLDSDTGDMVYSYNDNTTTGVIVNADKYQYNPYIAYDEVTFNSYLSSAVNKDKSGADPDVNYEYRITTPVRIITDIDVSSMGNTLGTSTSILETIVDGNGYTIQGINLTGKDLRNSTAGVVDKSTFQYTQEGGKRSLTSFGLFREINGGVVKSLTLNIMDMSASAYDVVGSLSGIVVDGELYDISISGKAERVLGDNLVGGVAGYVVGSSRINDVTSDIRVTAVYSSSNTTGDQIQLYNRDIFRHNGVTADYNDLNEMAYAGGAFGVVDLSPTGNTKPGVYEVGDVLCSNIITNVENSIVGSIVGGVVGCVGANTNLTHSSVVVMADTKLRATRYAGGVVGQNNGTVAYSKATYDTSYLSEVYKYIDGTNNAYGVDTASTQSKVYNANTGELVGGANIQTFETPSRVIAVGGIVGINLGAKYTTNTGELYSGVIMFCNSDIYVVNNNADNIGGVVGVTYGGELRAVYAGGTVKGNERANVGGIVGLQDVVKDNYINIGHNYDIDAEASLIFQIPSPFDGLTPEYTLTMDYVVAQNNWASTDYMYYQRLLNKGNLGSIIGKVVDNELISTMHGGQSTTINYYVNEITRFAVDRGITAEQSTMDSMKLKYFGNIDENTKAQGMTRGAMIKSGLSTNGIYSQWDIYSRNGIHADGTPNIKNRVTPAVVKVTKNQDLNTAYWRPDLTYELQIDLDYKESKYNIIGTGSQGFSGTLRGNGHTIRNITIENNSVSTLGLFGTIKYQGVVEDVIFENIELIANYNNINSNSVGGLVGMLDGGTIKNVDMSGVKITTNAINTGGLVGHAMVGTDNNIITNANISGLEIGYTTNRLIQDNTTMSVGAMIGKDDGMVISTSSVVGKIDITENTDDTQQDSIGILNIGGAIGSVMGHISHSVVNVDITAKNDHRQHNLNIGGLYGEVVSITTNTYTTEHNIVTGVIAVDMSNEIDKYEEFNTTTLQNEPTTRANVIITNIGGIAGVDMTGARQKYISNLMAHDIILTGEMYNPDRKNVGGVIGKIADSYQANDATKENYIAVSVIDNTSVEFTDGVAKRLNVNAYFGSMQDKVYEESRTATQPTVGNTKFATDAYYTMFTKDANYELFNVASGRTVSIKDAINNKKKDILGNDIWSEDKAKNYWDNALTVGTKLNPILISSLDQLKGINKPTEYKYYLQTKDILVTKENLMGRKIILDEFAGFYNGNGHRITINGGLNEFDGLIGNVGMLGNRPSVVTGIKMSILMNEKEVIRGGVYGLMVGTLGEGCVLNASGVQGALSITGVTGGSEDTTIIGGVVGVANGKLNNCYSAVILKYDTTETNVIVGGIIGKITGANMHSNLYTLRHVTVSEGTGGGVVGSITANTTLRQVLSHSNDNKANCVCGTNIEYDDINVVEGRTDEEELPSGQNTHDELEVGNAIWVDDGSWSRLAISGLGMKGSGTIKDPYVIANADDLQNFLIFSAEEGEETDSETIYYVLRPENQLRYTYDMQYRNWLVGGEGRPYSANVVLMVDKVMVDQGKKITITNVEYQMFSKIDTGASLIMEYTYDDTAGGAIIDPSTSDVLTIETEVGNVLGNENNGIIQGITVNMIDNITANSVMVGTNKGTITNVNVTGNYWTLKGTGSNVGAVTAVNAGVISNVDVSGVGISANPGDGNEGSNAGAVAGSNTGTIINANIEDVSVTGDTSIGGVVGVNSGSIYIATLSGCTITASNNAGGVAGQVTQGASVANITIIDCKISANEDNAGGIAGTNEGTIGVASVTGSTITAKDTNAGGIAGNAVNTSSIDSVDIFGCTITATNDNAGGIAGNNAGEISNAIINNTTKTVEGETEDVITDITATNNAGGIAGQNSGTITNGKVLGTIRTIVVDDVMALQADIEYVYVYIKISANANAGGIAGINNKNGEVITSEVSAINIISESNVGGLVGSGSGTITTQNNNGTADVSDSVITGDDCVGGIAGTLSTNITAPYVVDVTINGCDNTGGIAGNTTATIVGAEVTRLTIQGQANVGGVAGQNSYEINDCSVSALFINSTGNASGGIAGQNTGNINGCSVSALFINSTGNASGGIAGKNTGNINNCSVSASKEDDSLGINAETNAGGIVGNNTGSVSNSTVSGVSITATGDNAGGIAGINQGSINANADTDVNDCEITANNYAGGIAGNNEGTIVNANVSGSTITANNENAGGIAGITNGGLTSPQVNNCEISASNYAGGVVGQVTGQTIDKATINRCTITATNYAGGVAGELSSGTIDEADVSGGSITAKTNAGGIVGAITDTDTDKNTTSTISNSTATGVTITAKTNAGGIAGLADGNPNAGMITGVVTISDCKIESNTVKGSTQVGGVVGKAENATITNLIVNGEVKLTAVYNEGITKEYFGGIAGWSNSEISFTNTSFTINVTGEANYVGGLVGYSQGSIAGLNGIVITVNAGESDYVGGVFGYNNNDVNSLTDLENGAITITPTVTGRNYVGGIVGKNERTLNAIMVTNGTITGENYVAGIAGTNIDTINDCQLFIGGEFVITATKGQAALFVASDIVGTISASVGRREDTLKIQIYYNDADYTAKDTSDEWKNYFKTSKYQSE